MSIIEMEISAVKISEKHAWKLNQQPPPKEVASSLVNNIWK